MGWVDLILNFACLLLWLGWATSKFDSLGRPVPTTLAGTLRRAGPSRARRWSLLAAVPLVLLFRGWFYAYLGPSLGWTPSVNFGVTVLPFRCDFVARTLVYSFLSFGKVLVAAYLWLLLLAMVNRRLRDTDPFQRVITLLLGKVGRWPWPLQWFTGVAAVVALWLALHPLLVWCHAVPGTTLTGRVAIEGVLVWAGLKLTACYLIAAVLLGHLVNSYVYLGNQPLWAFMSGTATSFLRPLRWLPLRAGRFDAAPILGMVIVFLLAKFATDWLARLYPL